MTLRKALAQLALERVIELGGRGCRHRIRRKVKRQLPATARTIRLLTPFGMQRSGSINSVIINSFHDRVAALGFRLEIEHHPGIFERYQPAKLARLDALPDTAAWVLFYSNEQIQQWFVSRGRPTVLAGRAMEEIPLTTVFPDTEASGRHAAGLFYARGYREMVYLRAELTSLGDRLGSEAFVAEARRLGARARILTYGEHGPLVAKMMWDLIASRPRPTAYVVGASEVAITVLCHLLSAGIRVPADAGLIAMWDEHHHDLTFPTIARYRIDAGLYGRRMADAVLDVIHHGNVVVRRVPLIPEFVAGGSVGPAGKHGA